MKKIHSAATLIAVFACLLCIQTTSAAPAKIPDRPNIVVIFVDDLGYADLGVQGSKEVITPRIDSIAKDGIRFTDGYVTASQCSPSRAGIMTGRYQSRFGYDVNIGLKGTLSRELGLPQEEKTVAERLKEAGYVTGILGKWDLGAGDQHHPNNRGFDEFYGFTGGSRPHPPQEKQPFFNQIQKNGKPVKETQWSSDMYGDAAADFIHRHKGAPFFLYAAFTAPHWPMEAQDEDLALFANVEDIHRRTVLAMIHGLDRGVGRILDSIQKAGIADRTLVWFISDNGGAIGSGRPSPDAPFQKGVNLSLNDPLRGKKGELYEGGIRVPFLAMWQGVIPPGKTSSVPVISLDVAATAFALAGVKPDPERPIDGVNLMPVLTGTGEIAPRNLYWRVQKLSAMRQGDWKVVNMGKGFELFNLANDISESKNLADQEPDRLREMRGELRTWLDALPPPAW